ncbi:MAG: hypothetical protein DRQ37_02855 [Gammaproteobacteria bacterium]|nr:MAG: hypothetical protein DRQ37_02855 [Gammaproteobacteria bacterium]
MNERYPQEKPRGLGALLSALVRPADDWAQAPGSTRPSFVAVLAMSVLATFLILGALTLGFYGDRLSSLEVGLVLTAVVVGCGLIGLLYYQVDRHLLKPLSQLRAWALRMCAGDLSARITEPQPGEFAKLVFHINRLSQALDRLANEMDETVAGQTERLQEKNRSLEVLYAVAAAVNASRDLDELLECSAETLMQAVGGYAAVIRLRDADGQMKLHKRIGTLPESEGEVEPAEVVAVVATDRDEVSIDHRRFGEKTVGVINMTLRYQDKDLGSYALFTDEPEAANRSEIRKLLVNVGKHLGMAVEKARLDAESKNLSLMRERTVLAHELHDSLAQTLVSLRFQVKMLHETLDLAGSDAARVEVERIENSLDEANTELRELLANFRAPWMSGACCLPWKNWWCVFAMKRESAPTCRLSAIRVRCRPLTNCRSCGWCARPSPIFASTARRIPCAC